MSRIAEQTLRAEAKAGRFILPADEFEDCFTINNFTKLPENDWFRYELIEGEIIVSTATRYTHQLAVSRLIGEIGNYLDQNPIGDVVYASGLILNLYNSVIPDLIFISNERRDTDSRKRGRQTARRFRTGGRGFIARKSQHQARPRAKARGLRTVRS